MIKKVIQGVILSILVILGNFLLREDFIPFMKWWLAILLLGLIFMPLTSAIFSKFHDNGYLFAKPIGIAITGYLMWLFSSMHLLKYNVINSLICVAVGLLINVIVVLVIKRYGYLETKETQLRSTLHIDTIITEELLFLSLFLLFVYVRGFKPEAYGTEKFMDYGFMTSMMRSDYMPAQDFWFSGTKLNYYYVGQYLATYLTRISFVKVTHGYNLMLMMVGALAFVLPYSLVSNLTLWIAKENHKRSRGMAGISGLIAGAAVCLAGNMHYPTFQFFEPLVRMFFGMEAGTEKYWFPDATRFIGYHPETSDKTIHEFPAYSFVLGDLHAHVINVMFVITVLGILLAWLMTREKEGGTEVSIWKEVFHPAIVLISFFIGLFHTTNYWDFPIYYVVSGGIILFSNLVVYNFKRKAFEVTALQGAFVMIFSYIVCLPFTLNFDQISTTPRLSFSHTPINQLIILWGLPIYIVICFFCFSIANFLRRRKEASRSEEGKPTPAFVGFLTNLTGSDFYIIILGLCAIGLILIPEIIYIQDIYSGDYKRANTMFKLTYQAFIMFGICFGYIFPRLLRFGETRRQRITAGIGLFLFTLSLLYIQNAVNGWYGNIFQRANYQGLDAAAFMEKEMPDDAIATEWLNEHVTGTPVVLEANGDSYTDYQRVSVITGLPTVLGWRTHEWLWKSDTVKLDERATDIQTIYTSEIEEEVRSLLKKYQVAYIYVGKLEDEKYETINHGLLKKLGMVVFSSPATNVKEYETYIVQIDH